MAHAISRSASLSSRPPHWLQELSSRQSRGPTNPPESSRAPRGQSSTLALRNHFPLKSVLSMRRLTFPVGSMGAPLSKWVAILIIRLLGNTIWCSPRTAFWPIFSRGMIKGRPCRWKNSKGTEQRRNGGTRPKLPSRPKFASASPENRHLGKVLMASPTLGNTRCCDDTVKQRPA